MKCNTVAFANDHNHMVLPSSTLPIWPFTPGLMADELKEVFQNYPKKMAISFLENKLFIPRKTQMHIRIAIAPFLQKSFVETRFVIYIKHPPRHCAMKLVPLVSRTHHGPPAQFCHCLQLPRQWGLINMGVSPLWLL